MVSKFDLFTEPGTQVDAVCETDAANPTPTIQWKKNERNISSDDLVTITTTEVPGNYNANYSRSTIALTGSAENFGAKFQCVLMDDSLSARKIHLSAKRKSSSKLFPSLIFIPRPFEKRKEVLKRGSSESIAHRKLLLKLKLWSLCENSISKILLGFRLANQAYRLIG